ASVKRIVDGHCNCGGGHMAKRSGAILSRRRMLASASAAGALTLIGGISRPYLSRAADRPCITHGIQSGDVSTDSAMVWSRADRAARMRIERSEERRVGKECRSRWARYH